MSHPLRTKEQNERQKISVFASVNDAADAVAAHMISTVRAKPKSALGLATGQTPRRVYAELVAAAREGAVSFRDVTTFNLDEYCGLPASHPDSFAAFMQRELFGLADFGFGRINLIDGAAADAAGEAARYATLLGKSGGPDVQLLGLGTNGHIGFNEPGSPRDSRVRVVDLCEETLSANRPGLIELAAVPARAITMGIADILDAREIIMLATGPAKAKAVRRSLQEAPGIDCPASFLRNHPNIHWYLDSTAAAELA